MFQIHIKKDVIPKQNLGGYHNCMLLQFRLVQQLVCDMRGVEKLNRRHCHWHEQCL